MTQVPASRYAIFGLLAGGGLAADLYSKHVAFERLGYPHGQSPPWFDIEGWTSFRLYTSFNEGALWGLGQGFTWLFASLSVLAAAFVLYWLFARGAAHSIWLTVSLALVMAGTLGNLWDRLGLHHYVTDGGQRIYAVRDFLLFTFGPARWPWPVFNFADVFLVTGAVALVIQSLAAEDSAASGEQPAESAEERDAHAVTR